MSLRAATPTLRHVKTAPPVRLDVPTEAQAAALWALMRAAQTEGDLWKWSVSRDSGLVRCERWRGEHCMGLASYEPAEVARLGDAWPAHAMKVLSDPWNEAFVRGVE